MSVFSPRPIYSSGYEFDGIGAFEVLRGGAAIAVSDGWTSVYWNPANLSDQAGRYRREIGIEIRVGGMTANDPNSFNLPGANPFDKNKLNYSVFTGSLGGMFNLKSGWGLGFGAYCPLMQGSSFNDNANHPVYSSLDYEGFAVIEVNNVSVSRQISDRFSVGAGLDIIYGRLKSDSGIGFNFHPIFFNSGIQTTKLEGSGWNAEGVFGLKYNLNSRWILGAVFRTGSRVKIKGKAESQYNAISEKSDFEFLLKHPPTSGVGAALKFNKDTVVSVDFTQTWWKGFSNKVTYDNPQTLLQNQSNTFDWKNSWKVRLGFVKTLSEKTGIVGGYAFDVPAIDSGSVDFSTAIDVPMHRFSFGLRKRWKAGRLTFGGLCGLGKRSENEGNYKVSGWYFISEYTVKI